MRFLYKRGKGADRRVMHICLFTSTGTITMEPVCKRSGGIYLDTTCNVPLGRPICKRCLANA